MAKNEYGVKLDIFKITHPCHNNMYFHVVCHRLVFREHLEHGFHLFQMIKVVFEGRFCFLYNLSDMIDIKQICTSPDVMILD